MSSIFLLAYVSEKLSDHDAIWIHLFLISPTLIAPVFAYFASQNRFTKETIIYGWPPMLLSVLLEQPGAVVMQGSFQNNQLVSAIQPIVNGVARNIIGIQAGHVTFNLKSEMAKNEGKMPVIWRQFLGPFCSKGKF